MLDVIIIGAGPIGSFCARELAEQGYQVLVVEEHSRVGVPVHCTGIIGAEAYERFDLPKDCVQVGLRSVRLLSPLGTALDFNTPEVRAWVVDRKRFDQALAQSALAAGASFLLSTRAQRLLQRDDRIVIQAHVQEETWDLEARLCLLATGADDTLADQVGLGKPAAVQYGAQTQIPLPDLKQTEVYFGRSVAPHGFAWAVPTSDGSAKVGLLTSSCARTRLKHLITKGPLAERTGGRNGHEIHCRPLPTAARPRVYAARVLATGDAAGQVKTTTGGGIFYGLLGAEAAVHFAARALETKDFSETSLARYQTHCLRLLGKEQSIGRVFRRLGAAMSDGQLDAAFRALRRLGLPRRIAESVRFDWHASDVVQVLRALS